MKKDLTEKCKNLCQDSNFWYNNLERFAYEVKAMNRRTAEKVSDFQERLVKDKLHAQQPKMVSDALRQLFIKYRKEVSMDEVRRITKKASKKAEKTLSGEVESLREETG